MNSILLSWLESEPITRLGWTLLHFVWEGAVIGVAYGLMRSLLFRAPPSVRYLAACAAMALCLAAPVLTWVALGSSRLPPPSPIEFSVPQEGVATPVSVAQGDVGLDVVPAPPAPVVSQSVLMRESLPLNVWWSQRLEDALPWCVLGWLAGASVLALRLCLGWFTAWRLRRLGVPVAESCWQMRLEQLAQKLGIKGAIRLLTSALVDSPLTVGWWRPVVLVPLGFFSSMPVEQVEVILAHELAHIRRRDYLVHALQCCIETVLFFHPVVWWIGQDLRQGREDCCDDLAVSCGSPALLAKALLSLEEARGSTPVLAQAVRGTGIVKRVRRLLVPAVPQSRLPSGWLAVAAMAVTAMLLAVAVHQGLAADVIRVRAGESIQTAIDKAPEGALIQVEAGVFPERITLRKQLTLEGAGWDRTILKPGKPEAGVTRESAAAALKRYQDCKDEAERLKLALEYADVYQRPTVLLQKAKGVVLRGLRIQGLPVPEVTGSNTGEMLVKVRASEVVVSECAIIGPFSGGIVVMDGGKLEMKRTLVAGLWETGVVITKGALGNGAPPTVTLSDCDVRNCYHRCITISPGCNDVRIERCRISGSAWHGIRYDSASPVIENNLIFANARSGIYASGDTKARVRGNVIFANEMDAISCWFANKDEINGNTFVANLREAVSVLGASHPSLRSNIFVGNPAGLILAKISGKSPSAQTQGEVDMENNLFWKNDTAISAGGDTKSLAGTNTEGDPLFVDMEKQNFALQPGSPARKSGIGAADPLVLASPWPLQPEERQIIPVSATRKHSEWQKPGGP